MEIHCPRSATLVVLAAALLSACGAPASRAGAIGTTVALRTATAVPSTAPTTGAPSSTAGRPATVTPAPATAPPAVATAAPALPTAAPPTTVPLVRTTPQAPAAIPAQIVEPSASNYQSWTYHPDSLTIHVGQEVTWTNAGEAAHTVTADDGAFDSRTLGTHQRWTFVFSKAGTYAYHCTFHPWMKGTVTVLR